MTNSNPVFTELLERPKEYLVLNTSDEWLELPYDGETPTCPPNDEVLYPNPKAQDKPSSGKDAAGNYIPGSLLIRDIYGSRGCPDDVNGTGTMRGAYWSAMECLKHALGLDPATMQATSPIAKKGLVILPLNPDPETVEKVRAEGRARNAAFMEAWAHYTLGAFNARTDAQKADGKAPMPPRGSDLEDYYRAIKIAKRAENQHEDKLRELGASEHGEDAELLAFAKAKALETAERLVADRPELDKDKIVEMLMADPEYRKKIDRFRIKDWQKKPRVGKPASTEAQ